MTALPSQARPQAFNPKGLSHNLIPELYLITNDDPIEVLLQKLEAALASGVISVLQIRRKRLLAQEGGRESLMGEAKRIIELAKRFKVTVVMNDDLKLACQLGIGVHLGQEDGSVIAARQLLGEQALIGRTCLQSPALVTAALTDGASYAAMGAIFASQTKPSAKIVSRSALSAGCDQGIDICVIGGISASNAKVLAGLPIRYIAVVGDILNYPVAQIAHRCELWRQCLTHWPSQPD